jgi:hypothetical protein
MKPTKSKRSRNGEQNLAGSLQGTTRVQELQLELIELVNFNKCKGKKVAALLRENRPLRRAALMPGRRLDQLRDMEFGEWSADTLYVLPIEGQEEALEKLAKRFDADEITWLDGKESLSLLGYWKKDIEKKPKLILSVWWA